jgi:hypothetical protein
MTIAPGRAAFAQRLFNTAQYVRRSAYNLIQ